MIMIRPGDVPQPQKILKPPPPVPPRPSKTLVQEALAKSRQNLHGPHSESKAPIRLAPPPPPSAGRQPIGELKKSISSGQVNVGPRKPPSQTPPPFVERTISLDKVSSRPVVYQSENVRKLPTVARAAIAEKDAPKTKVVGVKKVGSFNGGVGAKVTVKRSSSIKTSNASVEVVSSGDESKTVNSNLQSVRETKESESKTNSLERENIELLNDRNHVNTLIDEMFASVLEVNLNSDIKDANDNKIVISNKVDNRIVGSSSGENLSTVIVISDDSNSCNSSEEHSSKSNSSTSERKVKFNDRMNHELLIEELQNMKNSQEGASKRQRLPSVDIFDEDSFVANGEDKIHTNDWFGLSDEGKEVKMSSCHITIEDSCKNDAAKSDCNKLDFDRIIKMSHLHGLPPLPKSLSGFNFLEHQNPPTPVRSSSIRSAQGPQITPTHHGLANQQSHLVYSQHSKVNGDAPSGKKTSSLDAQLAILRREMYTLRQQDLSLLSQLWSLNEAIQDFRQILQDQEDRILSPPSPSPTPSSIDEEEFYMSATSVGFRPNTGLSGRKLSGSSAASGSVG